VVFGSDVTATDDPSMQEPELRVLRKGFARVMTADEIVAALRAGVDPGGAPAPDMTANTHERPSCVCRRKR
jgi:hypothetical protein